MEPYKRHLIIWKVLYKLLHRPLEILFSATHEDLELEGPCIIISNHANMWDPLLVALSLEKKHAYFVASEHLFRKGLGTKLLNWLLAPISRKKASVGSDTVKVCLRHLKAGHSICLFGEGEATWNGVNKPIFPATGKMVKVSGASLVTYRLEGAYMIRPRWAEHVRKGKMHGHPVNIYPPEVLKQMTPQEINELIDRDIYEDAWARQRAEKIRFTGRNRAKGMEKALFLCPKCRKVGSLKGRGDKVGCACGFETRFTETGFFDPPEPFENIYQWDMWQHEQLKARNFEHDSELLFSDDSIRLSRIDQNHHEEPLWEGALEQYDDFFRCGDREFQLDEISKMDMVQTHMLLFQAGGAYYQLLALRGANMRKYLAMFKQRQK